MKRWKNSESSLTKSIAFSIVFVIATMIAAFAILALVNNINFELDPVCQQIKEESIISVGY